MCMVLLQIKHLWARSKAWGKGGQKAPSLGKELPGATGLLGDSAVTGEVSVMDPGWEGFGKGIWEVLCEAI